MENVNVGRGPDRDEAAMPVFDADAPAPVSGRSPRSVAPGRRPGRARGVGVAVAALVLLTAGVAIGGILEAPAPSGSPASSASKGDATASAVACQPPPTNTVPAFVVRGAGSELGIAGVVGYSRRPGLETSKGVWPLPAPDPGRGLPELRADQSLELRADPGVCIRFVEADYADATLDHAPQPSERHSLVRAALEPPSPNPSLGPLPRGDWIVRVVAYFHTGDRGTDGLLIGERYFRVRVGGGPFATPQPSATSEPRPAVTPAVPCGPAPADADAVEMTLSAPGVEAVAGAPDGAAIPVVSIGLGDHGTLAIAGDVCAIAWDIELLNAANGVRADQDVILNPADDPAYASQNRWDIQTGVGEYDLVASVHLAPGLDVVRVWRVTGLGFTVPDTFLVGADGSRVMVLPGCGLTLSLANGYSGVDSCRSIGYPVGLELLHVPAWSRVTIEIPGWTISGWNGYCGRVSTDDTGLEFFDSGAGCGLGSYTAAPGASPPAPAQFLARPGEQVVQLWITAIRDGDSFSGPMFARVIGE